MNNSKIIILNPEKATRLDYEHNWKDLLTYESYLSMKAQQQVYEGNAKGYERLANYQKNSFERV
jgi:hypothetical protein